MLNHITIMGRLTRDVELRYTQSNTPVANYTVAVDRDFTSGSEKQTDFIDCVAWRSTAEFASKYFHKGSMAVVSGRLQINSYTDRDGNKRSRAEILVDNMYFGESKSTGAGKECDQPPYGNPPTQGGNPFSELKNDDGELPF